METINFPKVRFDNAVWIPISIIACVEGRTVPVPQDDIRDIDGVGCCISEDVFIRMLEDGVLDRDAWAGNKGDTVLEEAGCIDAVLSSTPRLPVAPNMDCGQLAKCVQMVSEKHLQLMLVSLKPNGPVRIIESKNVSTLGVTDDPSELAGSFHDAVVKIKAAARKFNEYKDLAQFFGLSLQLFVTWHLAGGNIWIEFFLAGKGIFYSFPMFMGPDILGSLRRLGDGSITLSHAYRGYEYDEPILRPVAAARDFGAFSSLENIFWVMSHMAPVICYDRVFQYNYGSVHLDVNPDHFVKFANPYFLPEYMMFSGLPDVPEISSEIVTEDELVEEYRECGATYIAFGD